MTDSITEVTQDVSLYKTGDRVLCIAGFKGEVNVLEFGVAYHVRNVLSYGEYSSIELREIAGTWDAQRHFIPSPLLPPPLAPLADRLGRFMQEVDATRGEQDPTGRSQHAPGAKVDAGKVRPSLVLGGFARALWAVSEIGTFGATKYTDNGWMEVPNGQARYDDAQMRHWLKEKMGEPCDADTQKTHLAHEAWNALAKLDLHLRNAD